MALPASLSSDVHDISVPARDGEGDGGQPRRPEVLANCKSQIDAELANGSRHGRLVVAQQFFHVRSYPRADLACHEMLDAQRNRYR